MLYVFLIKDSKEIREKDLVEPEKLGVNRTGLDVEFQHETYSDDEDRIRFDQIIRVEDFDEHDVKAKRFSALAQPIEQKWGGFLSYFSRGKTTTAGLDPTGPELRRKGSDDLA